MPSISSVSGTLTHGSSITISGSDFGTKTHAGPALYDNFDDADVANIAGRAPLLNQGVFASESSWVVGSGGTGAPNLVRNNSSLKARSTWHARAAFTSASYWALFLDIDDTFSTGVERYISFYYRWTKTSSSGNPGRQAKAWIAYDIGSNDKAYWTNSFGTCQAGDYWRTHATEPLDEVADGTGATEIDGEWVRFESYVKQSGANQANGAWHQTTYRPNAGTPEKNQAISDNYIMRTSSTDWRFWTLGGAYYDPCNFDGTDSCNIDIDEVILDSQRARVEIANTSTWAARTFSEYQVATAWATGEITVTLNAGHFGDTDTAYLYVVKSDGSVNANGFEITLGGGGGGAPSQLLFLRGA